MTFCPFIALSTLSHICIFAYHLSPLLENELHEYRYFISWAIIPLPGTQQSLKIFGEWRTGKKARREVAGGR